jgi:hypothetical protein
VLLVVPYAQRIGSAANQTLAFPEEPVRKADPDHLYEFTRGVTAARADVAIGRLVITGVPATYSDFSLLVMERYGVLVEELPSCALGFSPFYARGYNSVSRPAIRARLGTDTFPDCWYEAQERLRSKSTCCAPA